MATAKKAVAHKGTAGKPADAMVAPQASELHATGFQGSNQPPQGLFLSFFDAVSTLEDAANVFRDQARNQALPSEMREEAALLRLKLRREITDLEAAHSALEARLTGVGGPSDAQLRTAQRLSQNLAKDIHRADLTVALLTIVGKFVDAWTKIG